MAIQFLNNPKVGDNVKIEIGDSSDLQIYHDGNSKIETSTGSAGDFFITAQGTNHDLYLQAADNIYLRPQGTENGVVIVGNGDVTLYYDNAAKLSTTSSGATVTGDLTLEEASTPTLNLKDTTNNLVARFRAANSYAYITVDHANTVASSRLVFQVDNTTSLYLDHQSNAVFENTKVLIGTTSATNKLTVSDNSYQVMLIDTSTSNRGEISVEDAAFGFYADRAAATADSSFFWSIDDTNKMEINLLASDEGQLRLNDYGLGNITGTAEFILGVDSNGNVIETSAGGSGTVTGTGAATRVAFWSSTTALSSDANLYWDNTNDRLGIGTDTPSSLLEIQTASTSGSADFQIFSRGESPNYEVLKISRSAGDAEILSNQNLILSADYDNNHTGANSNIKFKTDNTERMRIDSAGNVGIGMTPASTVLLDLKESDSSADLIIGLTAGTGARAQIRSLTQADNTSSEISFFTTTSSSTSERMRIDSSGNFGFNVVPENSSGTWRNFEIGGGNLANRESGANDLMVGTGYVFKTDNSEVYKNTESVSRIFFNNDETRFQRAASGTAGTAISWSESMRIDSDGNVGIGTDSPTSKLNIFTAQGRNFEIDQSTSNVTTLKNDYHLRLQASGGYNLQFYTGTSASEKMRIDSSGAMQFGTGTNNGGFLDFDGTSVQINTQRNPNTGSFVDTAKSNASINLVGADGGSYIRFNTASANNTTASERMRIDSSGQVSMTKTGIDYNLVITNNSAGGDFIKCVGETGDAVFELDSGGTGGEALLKMYSDGVLKNSISAKTDSYFNGGNVGIGITNPSSKLTIGGNGVTTLNPTAIITDTTNGGSLVLRGQSPILAFDKTSSGVPKILMDNAGLQFKTGTLDAQGDVDMVISSNGNVGIGTTAPSAKLNISNSSNQNGGTIENSSSSFNQTGLLVNNTSSTSGELFRLRSSGSNKFVVTGAGVVQVTGDFAGTGQNPTIQLYNTDTSLGADQIIGDLDWYQSDPSGDGVGVVSKIRSINSSSFQGEAGLAFHTGTSTGLAERMRIESTGNVKINTTVSTLGKLSVRSQSGANTFYNNIQCVPSDATTGGLFLGSNVANDAIIVTGAYYANAGNYTPTATSASIINMFSGNIVFRANDSLTVGTNYVPTERMRITSAGNVGIGTTAPSSKLHVVGAATAGNYAAYIHNASGGGNVLKLYNHDWDVTDFLLYATNGGTAASGYGFTVDGNARVNIGLATVAAANSAADDLHLRSLGSNGITISSGNAQTGTIFFGDAANSAVAGFRYNHNTGDMAISAEDNVTFACDNVGIGDTSPGSKLEVVSATTNTATFRNSVVQQTVIFGSTTNTSYSDIILKTNSGTGEIFKAGTGYTNFGGALALNIYNSNGAIAFHPNGSANAMYIDTSSNVGMGTTNPSVRLDVVGPILGQSINDTASQALFRAGNANNSQLYIQDYRTAAGNDWTNSGKRLQMKIDSTWMGWMQFNGNGNNSGISWGTGSSTTQASVTERMRIDSSGNVGIGDTSPVNTLDIYRASGDASIRIHALTAQNSTILKFRNSNADADITVDYASNNRARMVFNTDNSGGYVPVLSLESNRDTLMYGNVGIGTTAPTAKLHVDAPLTTANSLTYGAAAGQIFTNENSEFAFGLLNASPYPLYIQGRTTSNTARDIVLQTLGGNVGIGTTDPDTVLELEGADPLLKLSSSSATGSPYLQFAQAGTRRSYIQHIDSGDNLSIVSEYGGVKFYTGTGGTETEKMVIQSDGDVGIGVTNPVNKLQVGGKIYSSTDIQAASQVQAATLRWSATTTPLEQSGALTSAEPANPPDFTPDGYIEIKVQTTVYLIPIFEKET